MKASLRPGVARTKRIAIDRDRTISFMGEEARVYATPRLVGDVEYTCRDFLLEHLDAGEDSVGIEIALKHLAPTLMGMTAEITVKVAAGEGRLQCVALGQVRDRARRRALPPCPERRSFRRDSG